jgi:hypothetical protein
MAKKAKKMTTEKVQKTETRQFDLSNISKLLFERTQEWAKEQGLLQEKKDKYSTKVKTLDSIINKGKFGCQEEHVRKIVAEIIGEKLPPAKDKEFKLEFLHGVVVVPLTGNNYYPVGEPVLVKDKKGYGIGLDGLQPVERLTETSEKSIRPATIEEIEVLVESLLKIDDFAILLLGFILNNVGK